jgi:hypothetical protein
MENNKEVSIAEHGRRCKQFDGLYSITEPLTPSLCFKGNVELGQSMMVSFGVDPKSALVTIYGADDAKEIVVWHRDGTVTILDPAHIDEAAQIFVKAVANIIKQEMAPQGFVVRRRGVNEFLKIECGDEEWVQNPDDALHFARQTDASWVVGGNPSLEVVPVPNAMVF